MRRIILLNIILLAVTVIYSQEDTVKFKYYGFEFFSYYDTSKFCSEFKVTEKGKLIYKDTCTDRVISINSFNLKDEDNKQLVIDYFTGGAHCCFYTFIGEIQNNKFKIIDSIFWGNGGYEMKDLDNDGVMEIVGSSDIFAYAFTNYAETRFPTVIYKYKNGKIKVINKEFPEIIEKEIKENKADAEDFVKKGYESPKNDTDDTFNTDAGSLKTILAPIVADYYSLGRVKEGYDFVEKMYKCPDKEKYINTLKKDFKFK